MVIHLLNSLFFPKLFRFKNLPSSLRALCSITSRTELIVHKALSWIYIRFYCIENYILKTEQQLNLEINQSHDKSSKGALLQMERISL